MDVNKYKFPGMDIKDLQDLEETLINMLLMQAEGDNLNKVILAIQKEIETRRSVEY